MLKTTLVSVRLDLSPRPKLSLYCFAVLLGASCPKPSSPYCPPGWLVT